MNSSKKMGKEQRCSLRITSQFGSLRIKYGSHNNNSRYQKRKMLKYIIYGREAAKKQQIQNTLV